MALKRRKARKKRIQRVAGEMKTSVYLNGRLIGYHENGNTLVSELRARRRSGSLSVQTNFYYRFALRCVF